MSRDAAIEFACRMAGRRGEPRYTAFLDPAEAADAAALARLEGVRFGSWGGWDEAERQVGCFSPVDEEPPGRAEYPLVCLCSGYDGRFASITHRDVLGAYMSLALTRSCLGDIIIGNCQVFLFCLGNSADYICENLTEAGRTRLRFAVRQAVFDLPRPKGEYFRATVSSLRLDAMIAAAYRISRALAGELIRAGAVKMNFVPCERTDAAVPEGAVFSVRGRGRVRFASLDGSTRKERLSVTFFTYE